MPNDPSALEFREDGTPFRSQGTEIQRPALDAELAALLLPRLVDAFGEALTACELRLYALANRESAEEGREAREVQARELYRQRGLVLDRFRQHLAAQREAGSPAPAVGLRVADERHEAELAFGLLLNRAGRLLGAEAIQDFPFSLANLAAALKAALADLNLGVDAELLLYKFLERRLLSRLPRLLAEARAELERGAPELRELGAELSLDFSAPGLDLSEPLPAVAEAELQDLAGLSLDSPAQEPVLPLPETETEAESEGEELVWPLFRVLSRESLPQEIRAPLWSLVNTLSQAEPGASRDAETLEALEDWLAAGVSHARAVEPTAEVMLANLVLEQSPLLGLAFRQGAVAFKAALSIHTRVLRHWLPAPVLPEAILPEAVTGPQDFLGDTVAVAAEDAPDFQRLQEQARERRAQEPAAPQDWKAWLFAHADDAVEPEQLAAVAALAPGDWLRFSGVGLPNLRGKLVAHLQGPERYLLCDWRGRKLAEATPVQLAAALRAGVLSLDILSLRMDKPLEQLMGALKQRKEQGGA